MLAGFVEVGETLERGGGARSDGRGNIGKSEPALRHFTTLAVCSLMMATLWPITIRATFVHVEGCSTQAGIATTNCRCCRRPAPWRAG